MRCSSTTSPRLPCKAVQESLAKALQCLDVLQAIDAAAIKAFAQKLLSGKASGVLVGDQAVMPKFDTVSSRFGS